MLKELLENAIKFTPEEGSIELCVTALPDREAVSIVVADNGIGMSAEQLGVHFPSLCARGPEPGPAF